MPHKKTIFITGASAGLGRALALQLSQSSVHLALMARDDARLEQTKNACQPDSSILLLPGDVTIPENCKQAIEQTIQHFGRLDYLILNAGISMFALLTQLDDTTILRRLMETNYLGAANCLFYALPHLVKNKGMVVAISSIQGKIGVPYYSGYSASKHALEGFLEALRLELKNKVDFLVVSPGWIGGTEMPERALKCQATAGKEAKRLRRAQTGLAVQDCARSIIRAMDRRKRRLFLPGYYQWVPWLKLIAPGLLNRLILRYFPFLSVDEK